MEKLTVKDLMVPLSGYATVSQDSTLLEAVKALKNVLKNIDKTRDRYRAILVTDKNNRVVGKLSQLDVIRALEPKYSKIDNPKSLTRFGFSQDYLQYTFKEHNLWEKALDDLCEKAVKIIVKNIMYTPAEGEYVQENTSLNAAIHQLIMGRHQSLLVTRGADIVGVLRLSDVFKKISDKINSCSE